MSEETKAEKHEKKSTPADAGAFVAESQKERWLKYGANVALTVVIVLALASFIVYIVERHDKRWDTTVGGNYSLKPQTVKLVEGLPQKFKLVGLFNKSRHEEQEKKIDEEDSPAVRYQKVEDLLQEYAQKAGGGKVTYEMIDSITEPSKLDALFLEVQKKYGNDLAKYQSVLDAYPRTVSEINKLSKEEREALAKLLGQVQSGGIKVTRDTVGTINDILSTVAGFPEELKSIEAKVKQQLELKVPDYRGAVDTIKAFLGGFTDTAGEVLKQYKDLAASDKTPKEIKDYIAASTPRFEALKKEGDDLLARAKELGDIKQIDELRQNKRDAIVVMGEKDMKVLTADNLFPPIDARAAAFVSGAKPRQRFAGEQQVTTALYTLSNPNKRKIAFVRSSGPPQATRMPFAPPGMFTVVGDRLRDLDFEVLERDISGTWAMQAQMQRMPMAPEANDEQLKDAIWIVIDLPVNPQEMPMNPAMGQLGAKLAEHLKNGGSAMVLGYPGADNLSNALGSFGVELKTDYTLVHEKVEANREEDFISRALREQPIFQLSDFGDHFLTRPIQSLNAGFVNLAPVSVKPTAGVKSSPLLPIPKTPKAWAEYKAQENTEGKFDYNPAKDGQPGDYDQGLYGGAAAEKDNGQRLLVYGTVQFPTNDMFRIPDPANPGAMRFPGNGELFTNSIYWLAKMDSMIAISPSALEVPRVAAMSDASLALWRVGVMIIGLPALVLAAGSFVWLKRRD